MHTSLKKKLVELELYLLKADVRVSVQELDQLIHDDFIEFASSGISFGKREVLKHLPREKCPEFSATAFELRQLSSDVAQLLYKASMKKPGEFVTRYSLRSSLWRKTQGRWQMIFHQGTPCEPF